jgi:hypothetical protein
MQRKPISALLFALALLLALPLHLDAQVSPLRGTYMRDEAASDRMEEIVESGMSKLGSMYRVWPICTQAYGRFVSRRRFFACVQIIPAESSVTVQTDQWNLTTPRNGRTEWERTPDDLIDVATKLQDGRLEQAFEAEDGKRVNVYTLSPDGDTLFMDVTVTSPKLDSPLTYRMVYRRRD